MIWAQQHIVRRMSYYDYYGMTVLLMIGDGPVQCATLKALAEPALAVVAVVTSWLQVLACLAAQGSTACPEANTHLYALMHAQF